MKFFKVLFFCVVGWCLGTGVAYLCRTIIPPQFHIVVGCAVGFGYAWLIDVADKGRHTMGSVAHELHDKLLDEEVKLR